ncbi:MAG: amylo-alpha-1,6-glucosidase [Candidatus Bathyarchaeia archaeon]|nr:MAG: glycogen debranching protein [Candidatus Bathyarchaeota archaeon]
MSLPSIRIYGEALSRFDDVIQKEWLVTNGLGGYASSTVLGINTRKYHGLLIAALNPPGKRIVCLTKLDEEVAIEKNTYPLFANEFKNKVLPTGNLYLKEFSLSPTPKYVYEIKNFTVQKNIFMPYNKNALVTVYNFSNAGKNQAKIRIFPIVNCRHIHEVTDRWRNSWDLTQTCSERETTLKFEIPRCTLAIAATGGRYVSAERWIEGLFYREEAMRGESCLEDCYQTGYFEVVVDAGKVESFAVVTVADKNEATVRKFLEETPLTFYDISIMQEEEKSRYQNLILKFYDEHPTVNARDWLNWIILAADKFIVQSADLMRKSVIAGYHWFESWGRDTFISMPGLMLVTGRFEDSRKVFLTFKEYCKDGLIPNFIPDTPAQPAYNSVDAPLWFINAVLQYLKHTGDFKFVKEQLWETLKAIIDGLIDGKTYGIRVDSDCLVEHNAQLTWMDAVVDGQPVTPRDGKAVEVQALWFNALKFMEILANKYAENDSAKEYACMAENVKKSFVSKFWNAEKNYLFDVVSESFKDDSLRPNQIIAVSLDFTMLDQNKNEKIVGIVHRELLTPYGLRTLARGDPKYIGTYAGDRRSRDKAYHNGTVWPWLLGSFTTAFLKAKGYAEYRREQALNFLLPLFTEQINRAGLGLISEIFDGDPPHNPRGCIAQAWSIAEPLRAYVEDVLQIRPKHEKEILQKV